jgi:hypothetical protein
VAEAEARERKFVARAKQAEPQAAPAAQPPAVQPPAATAATQPPAAEPSASDKLTAIQTGKKKLRGIRINPDLE